MATAESSSLGFTYRPTAGVFHAQGVYDGAQPVWQTGEIRKDACISLSVSAAVLSYGCGIIEGLKAYRQTDGRLALFRPWAHARRFQRSAERLLMPPYPQQDFVDAAREVVRANEGFVPRCEQGSFYLRPMQHCVDEMLGLRAGRHFSVIIYGCPVGTFWQASDSGLQLTVADVGRCASGGTGAAKAIGNYAGTLTYKARALSAGYDDVLYLDAERRRWVRETGGANVFCLLASGVLVTPELDDTVLSGVTRNTVIQLAKARGTRVEERPLSFEELCEAGREVFCTGTAWGVRSVRQCELDGNVHSFRTREFAQSLALELADYQAGRAGDPYNWLEYVSS